MLRDACKDFLMQSLIVGGNDKNIFDESIRKRFDDDICRKRCGWRHFANKT